ncbi:MAG: hypothetical protein KGL39_03745 [Patescibacteria group bacterium]|nr:hypothetical protein [Patescibacteria group bacterium]
MAGILPSSIEDATPQNPGGASEMPMLRIVTNGDKTEVEFGADEQTEARESDFDENLAEHIPNSLSQIALDIIEGIDSDEQSRQGWVENYVNGLDLLGLKIETQSVARGRRSTSKVRHPLLLWSIIQFQAQSRGEMLPAAGPAKVTKKIGDDSQESNAAATDLERDINYYLTVSAPEYYPDTDRMLFYLGYGGTAFKKIYRCPVRQRPVSESVYLPDLIVSNDATDLENAERVTHRIEMMKRQLRRLQLDGIYRDVELQQPAPMEDKIRQKERDIQGRRQSSTNRPQDMPYTIYECYCFIDLAPYGLIENGAPKGLPLPYRITVDRDSRTVLEIRRNWREGDEQYRRRRMFVKFGLVPGMGFLDLGFLHLLGNQTKALTALWRVLIDSGIFSAAPAGIRLKGARADTNEINPGPGEFAPLDVPVDDIRKALMALPYKEPSNVLLEMIQMLQIEGQKIVGTLLQESGEGRTNIPVGTIMAMIEQQTQVMASVHKRLHAAQQEELILLKELFAENPEDLWRFSRNQPARRWQTAEEFANYELVPASDPNVPAQLHRTMQAQFIAQLATNPVTGPYFNQLAVLQRQLASVGVGDPQSLLNMNGPPPSAGPTPADQIKLAQVQQRAQESQQQLALEQSKEQTRLKEIALESADRAADRSSRERVAVIKAHGDMANLAAQTQMHREGIAADLGKQFMGMAADHHQQQADLQADLYKHQTGLAAQQAQTPPFGAPAES